MTGTPVRGSRPLRFGVVAPITADVPTWRHQLRSVADSGYSTILMPDVPQWQPAPGPALAVDVELALHVPVVGDSVAPFMASPDTDPAAVRAADSLAFLPSDPSAATEEIQRRRDEFGFSYFVFGADVASVLAPVAPRGPSRASLQYSTTALSPAHRYSRTRRTFRPPPPPSSNPSSSAQVHPGETPDREPE